MSVKLPVYSNVSESSIYRVALTGDDIGHLSALKEVMNRQMYNVRICNTDCLSYNVDQSFFNVIVYAMESINETFLDLAVSLSNKHNVASIVFTRSVPTDPNIIKQTIQSASLDIIVGNTDMSAIDFIIPMSVARFEDRQALVLQLKETKNKLAERKVVERAKGLLMQSQGLSEDEAYKTMRKLAMSQSKPLRLIAETTISILTSLK